MLEAYRINYDAGLELLFLYRGDDMELAEIRNELEKTAKRLADFRGSL
jgi:hypothetical protein